MAPQRGNGFQLFMFAHFKLVKTDLLFVFTARKILLEIFLSVFKELSVYEKDVLSYYLSRNLTLKCPIHVTVPL